MSHSAEELPLTTLQQLEKACRLREESGDEAVNKSLATNESSELPVSVTVENNCVTVLLAANPLADSHGSHACSH